MKTLKKSQRPLSTSAQTEVGQESDYQICKRREKEKSISEKQFNILFKKEFGL